MQPDKATRNYQLLELQEGATLEEIESAYRMLLHRYGAGSLASYGLLRVKERQRFLSALKEAYQQLVRPLRGSSSPSTGDLDDDHSGGEGVFPEHSSMSRDVFEEKEEVVVQAHAVMGEQSSRRMFSSLPDGDNQSSIQQNPQARWMEQDLVWLGGQLRLHREKHGIPIEEVALFCGCAPEALLQLERGNDGLFASSRDVRGVVRSYAKMMGGDGLPALGMPSLSAGVVPAQWSKSN
jgi:hypothetical protein